MPQIVKASLETISVIDKKNPLRHTVKTTQTPDPYGSVPGTESRARSIDNGGWEKQGEKEIEHTPS